MNKHLAFACALLALLTIVSCSENANSPDDLYNSSNAKRIVYASSLGGSDSNGVLWVSDVKGNNKRELMRGNAVCNSRIHDDKVPILEYKYNNEKQMRFATLYLYDLKTNTNSKLYEKPIRVGEVNTSIRPETALSPDGKRICFIVDSSVLVESKGYNFYKLYVMDISTRNVNLLADDLFRRQKPSISPDGNYIVYCGGWDNSGNPDGRFYVTSLDETIKQRLVFDENSEGMYSNYEWSDDNKYLIISSSKERKIFFINRNDWQLEKTILLPDLGLMDEMFLSKDNSTIYFSSQTNINNTYYAYDIYSYELNTGKITPLIGNRIAGAKILPKISSDGTTLLFSSSPPTATEGEYYLFRSLHTINLNNSNITTLPDKSTVFYSWVE